MSVDLTTPPAGATSADAEELTDEQYELADRIDLVLEAADREGMTRSAVAKKTGADYFEVAAVLGYLVDNQYAHTTGNGAWARYHKGRAR